MTLRGFGWLMLFLTVAQTRLMAQEKADAPQSAAEFVVEFVASLPEMHQAACANAEPSVKAGFDLAIEEYRAKVETIAQSLLATDLFAALKSESVSQGMRATYQAEHASLKERYANIDIARDCPMYLKNIRNADAELVEVGLTQAFAAMKANIALEKHGLLK